MSDYSQITRQFLTEDEIGTIRRGFKHMVEPGYGDLSDIRSILRVMAVRIESARRELDYVTRKDFPSMAEDAAFRITCEEAGLTNLAVRAGLVSHDFLRIAQGGQP